jgi:hypothetical protein
MWWTVASRTFWAAVMEAVEPGCDEPDDFVGVVLPGVVPPAVPLAPLAPVLPPVPVLLALPLAVPLVPVLPPVPVLLAIPLDPVLLPVPARPVDPAPLAPAPDVVET